MWTCDPATGQFHPGQPDRTNCLSTADWLTDVISKVIITALNSEHPLFLCFYLN